MTDPTPPPGSHDETDARIGAWLDGQLSEAGAEAFEAELAGNAELAARLEAVRAVRERLAGAPAQVPAGFAERVVDGIATDGDRSDAATQPTPLAYARSRREARRRRLVAAGSVAAALIVVAVAVPIFGGWVDRSTRDTASTADVAQEDAGEAAGGSGGGDAASDGGAAEAPRELEDAQDPRAADDAVDSQAAAPESPRDVPRIVRRRRAFDAPGALVEHFVPPAAARQLLGVSAGEAERLARRSRAALRDAPPLTGGTPAHACVAATVADVRGPAVVARVQPVRLSGSPLIAHVVATGPPRGALDTLRLHVRDPATGCDAVLTRRLASPP